MGIENLTILTHTHTECKDLWKPYFDSYFKFFNHNNHLVLINQLIEEIPHKQIIYSENEKYSNRLLRGLNSINTNYVLFDFEDMFLYDFVNINQIDKIINIMDNNNDLLFTRLIKSGIKSHSHFDNNLYNLTYFDFLFSITPTIWNRNMIIEFLSKLKNLNIWDLETNGDILLRNNNIKALYYYNNENRRGNHYDSSIYPHICSAILKGKWNIKEYSDILLPIIKKYNINIDERGIY